MMYSKSFVPVKTELWFTVLVNGSLYYDNKFAVHGGSISSQVINKLKWNAIIDIYVRVVNFEGI